MVLDENRESYWLGREYHLFRKEKWEICLLFLLFSFGLGAHVGKIALCGLRWFKLNVSKCQKDVKCQIVKHVDYGGGSLKK